MKSPDTFVLLGKPGSGKGTQAALLAQGRQLKVASTGRLLRSMAQEPTCLGMRLNDTLAEGDLVPEWLAQYVFTDELLSLSPSQGIVFESVCRKMHEAAMFDEITSWLQRPYKVFNIDVSDAEATKRILGRQERPEDVAKVIPIRLEKYRTQTRQSLEFFRERGLVVDVDGEQTPEEVHYAIMRSLDNDS